MILTKEMVNYLGVYYFYPLCGETKELRGVCVDYGVVMTNFRIVSVTNCGVRSFYY